MELFILVVVVVLGVGFIALLAKTESCAYDRGFCQSKGKPKSFSSLPVGRQYRVLRDEELHKANAYVVWDGYELLLVSSPTALHDTFVVGQTKDGGLVPNHCST